MSFHNLVCFSKKQIAYMEIVGFVEKFKGVFLTTYCISFFANLK